MSQRLGQMTQMLKFQEKSKLQQLRSKSQVDIHQLSKSLFSPGIFSKIQSFNNIIQSRPDIFFYTDPEKMTRSQERSVSKIQGIYFLEKARIDIENDIQSLQAAIYSTSSFRGSAMIEWIMHSFLYLKTILNFGNNDKAKMFVEKMNNGQHLGCFGLTEMYHGSYNQGMKTQAFYDHKAKQFRITTNERQGQKFWIGGAYEVANISVIWAQLYVNGECYGPHPFIVPLRNSKTGETFEGITIGDIGPKNGGNTLDSGWIRFKDVKIPLQNLLNKIGGINEQGKYISLVKSNSQRFGMHMNTLSVGRTLISISALANTVSALSIAFRYVCTRRQFSTGNAKIQNQLITYQLTKNRMIVPLAKCMIYFFGGFKIARQYSQKGKLMMETQNFIITQLHALSASTKTIITRFGLQAISECRQMLGGHGYSTHSRLSSIYHEHDPTVTGQGDNTMLLQQTTKVLLKYVPKKLEWKFVDMNFIHQNLDEPRLEKQSLSDVCNLRLIFQHLVKRRYEQIIEERMRLKREKSDDIWNELQPYFGKEFALMFGYFYLFQQARKDIEKINSPSNKELLHRCLKLSAYEIILKEKYGNLQFRKDIQSLIVLLCQEIYPDCMRVIDAIAPPSGVTQSPFLNQKGEGMKEYLNLIMTAQNTFQRVSWYKKLIEWKQKK